MLRFKKIAKSLLLYVIVIIIIVAGYVDKEKTSYAENAVLATDGLVQEKLDRAANPEKYQDQWATDVVNTLYGDLNEVIADVVNIISLKPDSYPVVWAVIKRVSDAIVPVAFCLASLFLLLSYLNKAMLFQIRTYEDAFKILLFMLVAKVALTSSFEIMGFIYKSTASLIASAAITPQTIINDADKEALIKSISNMSFLDFVSYEITKGPQMFIMLLIKVGIYLLAYTRLFTIYVYTALAPLPLATLASPDQYGIAKKFIQSYVGVCLQGLIMLLSCVIFSALSVDLISPVSGSANNVGGFILPSMLLLMVLFKAGSWGRQIAGLI